MAPKRIDNSIILSVFLFSLAFSTSHLFSNEHEKLADIYLKVFPENYSVLVNRQSYPVLPAEKGLKRLVLPPGDYLFTLKAEDYQSKTVFIQVFEGKHIIEEKLEKKNSSLHLFAELSTGKQPKSIAFNPEGTLLFTALLDGNGIDVFSAMDFRKVKTIVFPEPIGPKRGFVEMVFLPKHNELWVSQMSTGMVHAVNLDSLEYSYSIPTKGVWPKVIIADRAEKTAYVSNWASESIAVIDIDRKTTTASIPVGGTPRGLALSKDQRFLYVCLYDTGDIDKIDLESGQVIKTIHSGGGSKRHILLDAIHNRFLVSDMYRGSIYVISGETDEILEKIPIDHNTNTIALSNGGKYLFISTRGINNPETYLRKGPKFGKIYVLDTADFSVKEWIWGKNQPTGLALSPDSHLMAYSNFLDGTIEVYWTGID